MGEVKGIATAGGDYLLYDESFRSDRAHMLHPYPWNMFRADFYSKAMEKSTEHKKPMTPSFTPCVTDD